MSTGISSFVRSSFVRGAAGIAVIGLVGLGFAAPAQAMSAPYSTPEETTTADGSSDGATDESTGKRDVEDAVFDWSVNDESTGGSYFGGCNFFVAGEAGDAGSARIWTKKDAGEVFKTDAGGNFTAGNTSILKSNGTKYSTYETKCQTLDGTLVNGKTNAAAEKNHTGDSVRIVNGTGTVDPETNSATIEWDGSWSFVYYGGMTYWTISDPKLEVKNGEGSITGTYSGYGADMDDPSVWKKLEPREGTIVDIDDGDVDVTGDGFEFTPDFLGVKTDTEGRNPQAPKTAENESWWGAMPQDWIDFNVETGQDSYWFTSAGSETTLQPRKKTNPVTVGYGKPVDKPSDGGEGSDDGDGDGKDSGGDSDGKGDGNGGGATGDGSATLYWSLNQEANAGAFYGGCNFLSAGKAEDTGAAAVWTEKDGVYRSSAGNVTIEKPDGSAFKQASWANKCLDSAGETVSTTRKGSWTQSRVKLTQGAVTATDSGVSVQWKGSFTVAFYGGMTYWSATDPVLDVDSNGKGTLKASLSGYGADMFDASKWVELKTRAVTMANLKDIDVDALLDDGHITAQPNFLGVKYDDKGKSGSSGSSIGGSDENASAQAEQDGENSAYWGSFPQDFVDFQHKTGQYSYWFTSGGVRDPYKVAEPLTVALGDYSPAAADYSPAAGSGQSPQQGAGGPAGSGQQGAGGGSESAAGAGAGSPAAAKQSANSKDDDAAKKDSDIDDDTVFAQEAEEKRAASEVPVRVWIVMGTGLAVAVVAGFGIRSGIRRSIGLDPSDLV